MWRVMRRPQAWGREGRGSVPCGANLHRQVAKLAELRGPSEAFGGQGIGSPIEAASDGLACEVPSLLQRMAQARLELCLQVGSAHPCVAASIPNDNNVQQSNDNQSQTTRIEPMEKAHPLPNQSMVRKSSRPINPMYVQRKRSNTRQKHTLVYPLVIHK